MGPRAGLDGRKNSGFDPRPSSPWSVAIPTELAGPILSHSYTKIVSFAKENESKVLEQETNTRHKCGAGSAVQLLSSD